MPPKDISEFYQWLHPRPAGKGYTELAPMPKVTRSWSGLAALSAAAELGSLGLSL